MPTSANRNGELVVSAKVNCLNHIRDVPTMCYEYRGFVDHGVVDLARLFVAHVAWLDQFATQLCTERLERLFGKLGRTLGDRLYRHICSLVKIDIHCVCVQPPELWRPVVV